jgi:hypothetical protein
LSWVLMPPRLHVQVRAQLCVLFHRSLPIAPSDVHQARTHWCGTQSTLDFGALTSLVCRRRGPSPRRHQQGRRGHHTTTSIGTRQMTTAAGQDAVEWPRTNSLRSRLLVRGDCGRWSTSNARKQHAQQTYRVRACYSRHTHNAVQC